MANSKAICLAIFLFLALLKCCLVSATNVSYDGRGFILDGKRRIILSGSIHYPRSTPEMWPDLVKKAKEGGLNTIETYVFWNAHEPLYRQYDFTGNKDLVRFIKTIQGEGLHAVLRIGPYICGEWNYGGFPVWLHNIPGIRLRTKNDIYQNEMKTFTTLIVDKLRSENLFASQGGPIIIAQIENEYGNIESSYGNDGKEYLNWCANLALSYKVGIPWIMCQQGDAPRTMINTCNGYYCDQFWPNDASNKPKGWTENWVGWFKNWGMQDPHRTAEDVAFAVARFFQLGGSFQNYYMYHGGTNFNRSAGGPYIATTYDYDAPLDEYGNLNQPKWGHLKRLHEVIMSIEEILTYGEKRDIDYGSLVSGTIYSYEGKHSCFLGNANNEDSTVDLLGTNFVIPAWSVTVLPDCYSEVYNTAKVSSQTSIMVKEPNKGEDQSEPYVLEWKWRPEHFEILEDGIVHGSAFTVNELLDQKAVTNDTTDYLWYLTSVDIQAGDPIAKATGVTLHVRTEGHVIHVIFNGKHLDKKYGYGMSLVEPVKLEVGTNTISLLSATVGLQNYGANFDLSWVGIHGPVTLMGRDSYGDVVIKNLTSNPWTYKVGIHGMEKGIFRPESRHQSGWHAPNLPSNRELVWYKTTFKSPIGTDPVVVDLMGLGKGTAWVNGNNLGRYWPAYLASADGCTSTCDYRGSYYANKCMTNCGQPSQRYYHVPRSWLKDDDNELVLFEEFGGTPMNVQFYTVTVGSMCATPYEGQKLELSCQGGRVISEIRFASFGLPTGICGKFEKGVCEAKNTKKTIEKECLGKDRCTLDVSEDSFGPTGCKKTNQLMVEAVCSIGY